MKTKRGIDMKTCTNCGKQCNDNENFCSNCGTSTFNSNEQYSQNQQYANQGCYYNPINNENETNQNDNQQKQYNNYQQPTYNPQIMYIIDKDKSKINDAKICGIVSLVIILFGFIGFSWIPALIGNNRLASVEKLRNTSDFNTAKLLNKIGMILSIVAISFIVIFVIIYLFIFLLTGVSLMTDYMPEIVNEMQNLMIM